MRKKIVAYWLFASGSTAGKVYQTLKYFDGTTSCDCPGWTKRVDPDGRRSCKHVRLVESGHADRYSERRVYYQEGKDNVPTPAGGQRQLEPRAPRDPGTGRKFDFDQD